MDEWGDFWKGRWTTKSKPTDKWSTLKTTSSIWSLMRLSSPSSGTTKSLCSIPSETSTSILSTIRPTIGMPPKIQTSIIIITGTISISNIQFITQIWPTGYTKSNYIDIKSIHIYIHSCIYSYFTYYLHGYSLLILSLFITLSISSSPNSSNSSQLAYQTFYLY